tara:strand:- start:4638 stop:4871 length:234 start_codon:yes stop_codon:yes gene_type:complete
MTQVSYQRDDVVKHSERVFNLRPPISKNVSYARHQRHLNDKEEKLCRKFNCGYSTLVKSLIAEKYQREFGKPIPSFL